MKVKSLNNNQKLDLSESIGSGGEAVIYKIKNDKLSVAKIFKKENDQKKFKKIEMMLKNPPNDPTLKLKHVSIAWPKDILVNYSGSKFFGYVMPKLENMLPVYDIYNAYTKKKLAPNFSYEHLLRTCYNLSSAVASIHDKNYVIGDLNDANILVKNNALVSVIDTDSFQLPGFNSGLGMIEYTPPELIGKDLRNIERKKSHDHFGLAVIIHLLIMNGFHPYAGRGQPRELVARIKAGLCPYKKNGPAKPKYSYGLQFVPKNIRNMFLLAFVEGYSSPKRRPSAKDWVQELISAEKALKQCKNKHFYFSHFKNCPFCKKTPTPPPPPPQPPLHPPVPMPQKPIKPKGYNFYKIIVGVSIFLLIGSILWAILFIDFKKVINENEKKSNFELPKPKTIDNPDIEKNPGTEILKQYYPELVKKNENTNNLKVAEGVKESNRKAYNNEKHKNDLRPKSNEIKTGTKILRKYFPDLVKD